MTRFLGFISVRGKGAIRSKLLKLSGRTLLGTASALFAAGAGAQQPAADGPVVEIEDVGPVTNPVPQGQGWVNQRVPAVGQGGGQFGDPRDGGRTHHGLDLTAPVGTPVRSPVAGLVVWPTNPGHDGYGNEVRIVDANGNLHIFGHLDGDGQPQPGTYIDAGAQIGEVGRTGNTPPGAASHLHYEVRDSDNQPIPLTSTPSSDPAAWAAGFENYLDSLPRGRSPRPRAPAARPVPATRPAPAPRRQAPGFLQQLSELLIPSAEAGTLPVDAGAPQDTADDGAAGAESEQFVYDENAQPQADVDDAAGHDRPQARHAHASDDAFDGAVAGQQPAGAAGPSAADAPAMGDQGAPGASEQLVYDESNRPRANASATPPVNRPAAAAPQMTDEQYRAFMAVTMRQFQQQADAQEQALRTRPALPTVNQAGDDGDQPAQPPAAGDDAANAPGDGDRFVYDENAPRNGYDAQGNRANSPRQRYDERGNYRAQPSQPAPRRQNRAYSIDGSSRPIGRTNRAMAAYGAIQQQAYRQIAAQQPTGNVTSAPGPAGRAPYSSGGGQPAPSARFVYDENAPRRAVPSQSAVARRQSGVAPRTAGAQPPAAAVTPRQSGVAPRTAGIAPLN